MLYSFQWVLSDGVGEAVTERYVPLKRAPCFLSDARSEKFTSINKRNKWKCKKRSLDDYRD